MKINEEKINQSIKELSEKTFTLLATFFFATLFLLISIIFYAYGITGHNTIFIAVSIMFGLLFFTGYYFLIVIFLFYMMLRFTKNVIKSYKVYFVVVIIIFVIILLFGVYHYFDGMKGIVGLVATGAMGLVWKLVYDWINKKKEIKKE